jgi:hypothetical protein
MAFDGLSWHRLNRPVSEEEQSARLATGQPVSDTAADGHTVFSMNDSCIEVCDGNHSQKGWGVVAFLLPGLASFAGVAVILWMMTHLPPIYEQRGEVGLIYGVLGFFLVVMLGLLSIGLWALTRDCFNYTRKPIRFNRRDRMIYAFRHNGPGGVISVPWDNAFLFVERKPRAGLTRTAPRVVRCLVLNDKGRVTDTFSIGKRVVLAFDESSAGGQQAMKELYDDFEFYRRFMEKGPSSVPPVKNFLPTGVSFRNSLMLQFEGASDLMNSGNVALKLFMVLAAVPTFFLAVANYLSQLTCREPVWPEEVERACAPAVRSVEGLTT